MTRRRTINIVHQVHRQEFHIPGVKDVVYAHGPKVDSDDDQRALDAAAAVHGPGVYFHIKRKYDPIQLGPCNQDMFTEREDT
jgi:hypothetical protein